jgi:hypothetical protein
MGTIQGVNASVHNSPIYPHRTQGSLGTIRLFKKFPEQDVFCPLLSGSQNISLSDELLL